MVLARSRLVQAGPCWHARSGAGWRRRAVTKQRGWGPAAWGSCPCVPHVPLDRFFAALEHMTLMKSSSGFWTSSYSQKELSPSPPLPRGLHAVLIRVTLCKEHGEGQRAFVYHAPKDRAKTQVEECPMLETRSAQLTWVLLSATAGELVGCDRGSRAVLTWVILCGGP